MHVDIIEPTDRRWLETLVTTRHDFYHLPEYASLESSRLGGTAVAAYVEQPGVRLLLPVISRAIPGRSAFDLVSPYGYACPIGTFEDVALLRGAFSSVVQTLSERGFVSMFVRLHPILELPDGALTGLGTLMEQGQTVSVGLRASEEEQWRGIRARYRTFLNRSARLGHRAFMDDTGEHFDRFITLYLETMRRQNAAPEYFFSRDYLSGLWQQLRGHIHLGVVEVDGLIVCTGLFGESNGIVQYHLSGTDERALELSPLKILIDYARRWATQRGATVLHLGGGVGGAQDSLMHFKSGFSDRRHLFKTWRVVLDEQRYAEFSGGAPMPTGFFPAYRNSSNVTSVCSAGDAT
jgi:Acetyltransferase (GNAT) domain